MGSTSIKHVGFQWNSYLLVQVLGKLVTLLNLNKLLIGENVEEMIACDLKIEQTAHVDLKEAIAYCEQVQDYGSRQLFRSILDSEEEHIDWLETQQELIAQMGIQNYIQLQSSAAE